MTPEEELPDWVVSSVRVFLEPFFQRLGPLAGGYGGTPRDFVREVESTWGRLAPLRASGAVAALQRKQASPALLGRRLQLTTRSGRRGCARHFCFRRD
jgi:hypothetical protein